jgi:hypothetical protein
MATALFISRDELVKYTALNGNVDTDNFIQWVKLAQDIHIQGYLGTDLFNKINADIVANTLAGNYLMLVNVYIKPMLIHWSMVEFLPFAAYTIANKGVYKHGSENSSNVDKSEIDFLVEKERSIAQNYTRRFIDYMSFNNNLYPEYNTNSNADVFPSKESDFVGWVL